MEPVLKVGGFKLITGISVFQVDMRFENDVKSLLLAGNYDRFKDTVFYRFFSGFDGIGELVTAVMQGYKK
jgi:hypothetical protein